jgi:hypothetical protein
MGIYAATKPKGSRAQEAMFRQLTERITRVSRRWTDKPSGKGGESGVGSMRNFTSDSSDLATCGLEECV